jgi:hypothetical protein
MLDYDNTLLSIVALILIIFGLRSPFPSDDLLRDVIIGNYGFNYNNLYMYAPNLTTYNQYIGFDKLLFVLAKHIGRISTIRVVQIICLLGYIHALILIFSKLLVNRQDKIELVGLLVTYTMITPIMLRITLGRPEVIFTIWALYGVACSLYENRIANVAWLFVGICLMPFYWLGFLYLPVVCMLHKRLHVKILLFICMLGLNVYIWQELSNYQWLSSLLLWVKNISNRLPDAGVNENITIITMLLIPQAGIALFILSCEFKKKIALWPRREIFIKIYKYQYSYILLICLMFCIPNMMRYIDIIFPLIMVIVVDQFKDVKFSLNTPISKSFTLLLSIYFILMAQLSPISSPPKFNLPEGARVLASFDGANYYLPFFSKGNIKVAPSMEIGANDRGVQQLIVDIQKTKIINCAKLKKYNFNYLVEKSLEVVPNCLKLEQVQGGYRLWTIK